MLEEGLFGRLLAGGGHRWLPGRRPWASRPTIDRLSVIRMVARAVLRRGSLSRRMRSVVKLQRRSTSAQRPNSCREFRFRCL